MRNLDLRQSHEIAVVGLPLLIRHNAIRDAVAEVFGIRCAGVEALGARVKALLGLGLRRDGGPAPGSGRGYRNCILDALDVALALHLQRAFVPPMAAAALVAQERAEIKRLWTSAAQGEAASITISIDALSSAGQDGRRTGRFSEDPTKALSLIRADCQGADLSAFAPPTFEVDLLALYISMTAALLRVHSRGSGAPGAR